MYSRDKIFQNALRIAILLWLMFGNIVGNAQTVLQVASKTLNATIASSTIKTLHISAEKADIELIAWDKHEISVKIELSARHPDKSTATADLSKFQCLADRSGKDYFLRNYVLLKEDESKPVSNLKAHYTIYLPGNCAVDLKNTFGSIIIKGLTNSLQLKADFCTSDLFSLKGKGHFETYFGELKTTNVVGNISFVSDHSNLRLEAIGGTIKMKAHYGIIQIFPSPDLNSLAIQSKKADVTLMAKNWQTFDYSVNGSYVNMQLPNGFRWKRNTTDFKDAFFSKNQLSNIQINAEFGIVTIK